MNIVYIIPKITHGGGMPNVITEVTTLKRMGASIEALVVSLESGVSADLLKASIEIGLKTMVTPSPNVFKRILQAADIVVVHYWNCPSMYEFYKFLETEKIDCRICVNLKVNGCTLPQVVPTWVYQTCHGFIYSNPRTPTELLSTNAIQLNVPSLVHLSNVEIRRKNTKDSEFKLFHAGTLNKFKIHPRFIQLHSNLTEKKYFVSIWGAGADESFNSQIQQNSWINYLGFSENLAKHIHTQDLLCNPQTELSYGSYDKIMLESQWLGKPVITLKNSYISSHIQHNINGVVAADEYEYRNQLAKIIEDPVYYQQLAESTLHFTRQNYSLDKIVMQTLVVYETIVLTPKKTIEPESIPSNPLNAVLDGMGKWKNQMIEKKSILLNEEEINYALFCEGGLVQYFNRFPNNLEIRTLIFILQDKLSK